MKQITKEQIDMIISELQEAPAKYVYRTISLLANLPDIEPVTKEKGQK